MDLLKLNKNQTQNNLVHIYYQINLIIQLYIYNNQSKPHKGIIIKEILIVKKVVINKKQPLLASLKQVGQQ